MKIGALAVSVVCGCLVLGSAGLRASEALKAIVVVLPEIHAQLATDKLDGVKAPALALGTRAAEMGEKGAAMAKAAKTVADASDLKAARDAFGPLSDAVLAAAKPKGHKDLGGVKIAYCPMVRQSWLQKDDKIRNPYYGSTMLECGEFKKPYFRAANHAADTSQPQHCHSPRGRARDEQEKRPLPPSCRCNDRQQPHADHRQQESETNLKRERRADMRPWTVFGDERQNCAESATIENPQQTANISSTGRGRPKAKPAASAQEPLTTIAAPAILAFPRRRRCDRPLRSPPHRWRLRQTQRASWLRRSFFRRLRRRPRRRSMPRRTRASTPTSRRAPTCDRGSQAWRAGRRGC